MEKSSIVSWFWSKVARVEENDCWLWLGNLSHNGYGISRSLLRYSGEQRAHRFSFSSFIGPIPFDYLVLHRCDNRRCVNPRHLFLGSPQSNMDDKVSKNRQARMEKHGNAKLTMLQVEGILKDTRVLREVARDYGVSKVLISKIRRNHSWKGISRA